MFKRLIAVSALGSVACLGITALPSGAAASGGQANLKEVNGVLKFLPNVLNVTYNPQNTKPCKAKSNYQYLLVNKTSSTEVLVINGTTDTLTLTPGGTSGAKVYGCIKTGTLTYTVQGTNVTLTINSTPSS